MEGTPPIRIVAAVEIPPLNSTRRWNSCGRAAVTTGDVISASTLTEPADWPISVTLPGSPPKAAMLPCTNLSAWIRSSIAKSPESVSGSPVRSWATFSQPKIPRR
ncbi:hypothetical protein D9M68_975260 [compost metagenome]